MADIEFEVKITGELEAKIKKLAEEEWQVYYSAQHSPFVEFGTKPHFPPFEPIFQWCRRKLGLTDKEAREAAHAIQWYVYHHGTHAHPYLRPAIDKIKPYVQKIVDEGGMEALAEAIFNESQDLIVRNGTSDRGTLLQSGGYRRVK